MPGLNFTNSVSTIEASYAALPSDDELRQLLSDSKAAEARGYYDPIEDERLRETYARYLGIRSALWSTIKTLKPNYKSFKSKNNLTESQLQAFGIAFSAAEIIVRTGEFLIGLAKSRDIVWRKLDEAEPRFQLERKSFTRLYRQLTTVFTMHSFYAACEFYDSRQDAVRSALLSGGFDQISAILTDLNLPTASRGDHLRRYRNYVGFSLRRRRLSAVRNFLFTLFQGTGEDIADLKIPFVKARGAPKRVSADIVNQLTLDLKPGDVFITRHDDAMSNLFLPGFWPHGALFLGTKAQRDLLGVAVFSDGESSTSDAHINVLESKKDGVLLRNISETLTLDAFVVLRPQISDQDIKRALERGLSHSGKLYDFVFDFSAADRLACTEVIYRSYHGIGGVKFELAEKAGRKCLSAEDLLNQAISNGWFKPVIIFGVGDDLRHDGDKAEQTLRSSFDSTF